MQLNTNWSIELGRQVHRAFGSWQKAREAAVRGDYGVYRISRDRLERSPAEPNAPGQANLAPPPMQGRHSVRPAPPSTPPANVKSTKPG